MPNSIFDHSHRARLTRIVATLGPASNSPEVIAKLITSGVEVFRLNFSHGSHDFHRKTYDTIRAVARKLDQPAIVLQDISGPKLRIGEFVEGKIDIPAGEMFTLVADLPLGDNKRVGFRDTGWFKDVQTGQRVVLGDGNIVLNIIDKSSDKLECKVVAGGVIRSKWGLNFPDSQLSLGAITPKDRDDIRFGIELGVDVMALSFVQSAVDIGEAINLMPGEVTRPLLIAKIERRQAVENIMEILDAADGLMVARGDLGIDLPMELIPTVQKKLISLCRNYGKVVITATQMLESMTNSPRPTRAEVTDVANAVYDGTDAVMLSGETAVGIDPPLVVHTMANILLEAESHAIPHPLTRIENTVEEAVVEAAAVLVRDLGAKAVLVPYTSGTTAARISRQRLGIPVIAGAKNEALARRMRLFSGVQPFISPSQSSWLANTKAALEFARNSNWINDNDIVVATGGFPLGRVGSTNFVRAIRVGEEL